MAIGQLYLLIHSPLLARGQMRRLVGLRAGRAAASDARGFGISAYRLSFATGHSSSACRVSWGRYWGHTCYK